MQSKRKKQMSKKTEMKVKVLVDIVYDNEKHLKGSVITVPVEAGESWTNRDNPIAKAEK